MSDRSIWQAVMTWVSGTSQLVYFGLAIAILVVISTVVKRHRPDAYQALQLWAIGSLVVMVVMNIAHMALPYVTYRSGGASIGVETFMKYNALLTTLSTMFHVVLAVVLMRGLAALAQPPKQVPVEGAPPYR